MNDALKCTFWLRCDDPAAFGDWLSELLLASDPGQDVTIDALTISPDDRWDGFTHEEIKRMSAWFASAEVTDSIDQLLRAEINGERERRRGA